MILKDDMNIIEEEDEILNSSNPNQSDLSNHLRNSNISIHSKKNKRKL